ncbi:MAG: hypothetical protein JJU06_10685 [Ectothiorhodospiraceae bacterium]|nr:hypothetical protein [Ectothiorhodospiraceae bacterium]MCH8505797.1 hypothetical protein [Ectothiorhodospiraceae bacterium]
MTHDGSAFDIRPALVAVTDGLSPQVAAMLESAREARQNGELDEAERLLRSARNQTSSASMGRREVEDELYYHLPLTRVRRLLEADELEEAREILSEVSGYARMHPNRMQYMQTVDRYDLVIRHRMRSGQ